MSPAYSSYIDTIQDNLEGILQKVPFIKNIHTPNSSAHRPAIFYGGDIDVSSDIHGIEVVLTISSKQWRLIVQTRWSGEPRLIRNSCLLLRSEIAKSKKTNLVPVIAANYLSEKSKQVCKELDVGYIDLSGNCRLAFDNVFIERDGLPNSKIERRPLRSLFSAKSSRVIRLLLDDPFKYWSVQGLSEQARISIGLASKVKQLLLDREDIISNEKGLQLVDPEKMLKEWSKYYSYKDNQVFEYYAPGGTHELDQRIKEYCETKGIDYALTLFSAAKRFAPFIRGLSLSAAYVAQDPQIIAEQLNWKPVSSGANILLLKQCDDFISNKCHRLADRFYVVSDIQLYLDLASYKGRGEEVAQFIFDTRIKKNWAKEEW